MDAARNNNNPDPAEPRLEEFILWIAGQVK